MKDEDSLSSHLVCGQRVGVTWKQTPWLGAVISNSGNLQMIAKIAKLYRNAGVLAITNPFCAKTIAILFNFVTARNICFCFFVFENLLLLRI